MREEADGDVKGVKRMRAVAKMGKIECKMPELIVMIFSGTH